MQSQVPKEPIKRFTDIIDKDKMIEQLKKSGKVQVKLTFHYPNKTKTIKAWWCDSKQTILHFEQLVRKSFAIPETEGLFFYIDTKMPDKTKALKEIIAKRKTQGLQIDAATSEIF